MNNTFSLLALALWGCTGGTGTLPVADIDEDGFFSDVDCNDGDPLINPGAVELCDGIDNDCDGNSDEEDAIEAALWFPDSDGDGYGHEIGPIGGCEGPEGYIDNADDCDDDAADVNPAVIEVCDGIDNNCNGLADEDAADDAAILFRDFDGDGFGNPYVTKRQCFPDEDYVANDGDCDDARASVNPDGQEVCNEGELLDEDCDGLYDDDDSSVLPDRTWYLDDDNDGYGTPDSSYDACLPADGYVDNDEDCDDEAVSVNPQGVERCGDGVDNDCDTLIDALDKDARDVSWYTDADGDGFGDPSLYWQDTCEAGKGYAPNDDDCDDSSAAIRPGASEVWYDGVDQACDGGDDYDADSDGYDVESDCDDSSALASPGEIEVCGDKIDNDCDEQIDPCAINATAEGEALGDELGWSVHLADITGDAVDDLILGAPYQDSGATGAGAVYLITGPVTGDVSVSDGIRIDGSAVGEAAGWSLSAGADFDSDSVGDLVIGAYRLDGAVADLGGAYLLAGPITGAASVSDAFATLLGEAEDDAAAWTLDSGDLNGDDEADLLISAVDTNSGAGTVYVAHGPLSGSMRLWGADLALSGEASGDAAGYSAAFAGDLDGDGVDDLIVGAPYHSESAFEGAAYVIYGDALLSGTESLADADGVWLGESGGDAAGTVVTPWEDMDGDGYVEFLVGAPGLDGDASDTGAVYVVSGPASGAMDLSDATARLEGRSQDDAAGSALASAGDLNGDGQADFLVGAPGTDRVVSGGGAAYVVHGPLSGVGSLLDADAVVYGAAVGDAAGTTLLGGDLDGDGVDDALVGAPDAGNGELYILFGGGW